MRIVILDGYTENPGDLSWAGFAEIGPLTVYERTASDRIVQRIGDAEAVITNKVPIARATLDACPRVRYIGVLATGYNIIDVEACAEKGVVVSNIPTYGTNAVAQMTFALLLELCHHVGAHSESVFAGEWTKSADWSYWKYPLVELADKTMGVIGFGRIGQATARIAQAFGMKILANDERRIPELESETCRYVDLDVLFAHSDVISLHCPLLPSTQGIIDKHSISKMKDGVFIVNTSRGPLIVEEDLREALLSGKVGAAALDVVSSEPIKADNPLLKAQNCLITPHIAWAPRESRQRLMDIALENLKAFSDGKPVNVVKA
ncbi:MAG TPA: D-2-hydroxyacid dehydrogenase [Rectinemataceae bacterium]|nr:D-2-hydroxyacid dehydrogenase [Rectinemataceae bacterium]